jgi:hypothetical protein
MNLSLRSVSGKTGLISDIIKREDVLTLNYSSYFVWPVSVAWQILADLNSLFDLLFEDVTFVEEQDEGCFRKQFG